MKESRDFYIVNRINSHYQDLSNDLLEICDSDSFEKSKTRRGILFDFVQIGELSNQLSLSFKNDFDNCNLQRLIAIRNRIVHGYSTVKDEIIFNTLKNDLPKFLDEINMFSRKRYSNYLLEMLGKTVKVKIDRPMGTIHNGITYPLNYGYIEDLVALDGEFQDAYVIDLDKQKNEIVGNVIGIIQRINDIEDKLIVSTTSKEYTVAEIESIVKFQEQYFTHEICLLKDQHFK